MNLSLGDLIEIAQSAAEKSPFGLQTTVCLCEMEREYTPFVDAKLDTDDIDGCTVGAVFIISLHKLST